MRPGTLFFFAGLLSSSVAHAQMMPSFDIQGHRGARGLLPENTLPAFLAAVDAGATTLEMDVVITKDNRVLVSHEPWMSAAICTDSTGQPIPAKEQKRYNIYQMTYEQVQQFDCGSLGNPDFPTQVRTAATKPLLSDVIAAVEHRIKDRMGYEVDYNIEIKSTRDGDNKFHPAPEKYCDLVFALIDEYLPWDRVVIQSFDLRALKYWHTMHPGTRLSLLVENLKSPEANLAALGFVPSIYSPEFHLLSKESVDDLHRRGMRVIPWTVDTVNDMRKMKALGVDGIITDYPDKAVALGLASPRGAR